MDSAQYPRKYVLTGLFHTQQFMFKCCPNAGSSLTFKWTCMKNSDFFRLEFALDDGSVVGACNQTVGVLNSYTCSRSHLGLRYFLKLATH